METSDLDVYIPTAFLGSFKTNLMGFFQKILGRTITDLLLLDSGLNVDEPGSADSNFSKIDEMFNLSCDT